MLTEGFFKLHFEDQDVKQIGFVIDLKVMLDADMFDGAAFAGKPSAVLDIIRQAQLFEISLECFIVKHGIPGDRGDDFFSDFHI